jgi:hypothetical protein
MATRSSIAVTSPDNLWIGLVCGTGEFTELNDFAPLIRRNANSGGAFDAAIGIPVLARRVWLDSHI